MTRLLLLVPLACSGHAELMKAVIGLPNGYIVLPGFDAAIDTDEWDHLTQDSEQMVSAHPQFQMARLLHHLRIERNMIMPWPRADDITTADSKGRISFCGR